MRRLTGSRTTSIRGSLFAAIVAASLVAASCNGDNGNGNGDNGGGNGQEPVLFVLAALPAGVEGEDFGRHADVAVGREGRPMAAFTWNRTEDESLRFAKWEGDGWTESVEVEAISQVPSNQPLRQVSIAYDEGADLIGIAYVSGQNEVKLALSEDGGDTWSTSLVNEVDPDRPRTVANPALVMDGGVAHLAFWQAVQREGSSQNNGVWYHRMNEDGDIVSPRLTPLLAGTVDNISRPMGMAIDAEGRAALAYFLSADSSVQERDNVSLAYWRLDQSEASLVVDSSGYTYANASVSLGFDGTEPVVSLHHRLGEEQEYLFVVRSEDGVTWGQPILLPRDAYDRTGQYQSGAVAPDGRVAVAAKVDQVTGGRRGDHGSPKVYMSAGGPIWSVHSPLQAPSETRGLRHLSLVFDAEGTMHLIFQNESVDTAPIGVLHWRVPPPEED